MNKSFGLFVVARTRDVAAAILIKHVAFRNPVRFRRAGVASPGFCAPVDACPEAIRSADPSVSSIDHKNIRDSGAFMALLLSSGDV